VRQVFTEAQRAATENSRRAKYVKLRHIQEACLPEQWRDPSLKKGPVRGLEDFDENDFNEEVGLCLARILTTRKGEPKGEQSLKFLWNFLRHANEQGMGGELIWKVPIMKS
jgi:condensin complex subunit 3